jgi:hypothetical protein
VHVDAQFAARCDAAEGAFGVFDIGNSPSKVGLTWRVVRASRRTPSRASISFTASVTVERGRPISCAARVKLRRSTMRV